MPEDFSSNDFQEPAPPGEWRPDSGEPDFMESLAGLLPQYEFLAQIGAGGMGVVYSARQIALDRRVAIKFLATEISVHQDFVDRFAREARAMARLDHPNIVAIHDFGQTSEGHFYFVMDYVEGVTLRQMLAGSMVEAAAGHPRCEVKTGVAPDHALGLIAQVCDALAYAHGEGVVHRDIKPGNILVDTRGRVKVTDFGLARLVGAGSAETDLTFTGLVMGTPDYMAPEQRQGMNVDHRADIFSTGIVLYELLTGQIPRGAFRPTSELVPGLNSQMDEVIAKALQPLPDDRYQSGIEMKEQIESARYSSNGTRGVSAGPKRTAVSAPKVRSTKTGTLLTWLAASVVVLTILAAAMWPKKGTDVPRKHEPATADSIARTNQSDSGSNAPSSPLPSATPAPFAALDSPSMTKPRPWLVSKTANLAPPSDADDFQGSKYKLIHEQGTWIEAKAKAEALGGHLATITSKDEQTWLMEKFAKTDGDAGGFWIGGFLVSGSKTVKWVTGEPGQYNAWRSKEPSLNAGFELPLVIGVNWSVGHFEPPGWSCDQWDQKRPGFLVEWDGLSKADAAANVAGNWKDWFPEWNADEVNERGYMDTGGTAFSDGAVRIRFDCFNGARIDAALRSAQGRAANGDRLIKAYQAQLHTDGFTMRRSIYNLRTKSDEEIVQFGPQLKNVVLPSTGSHSLEFRGVGELLSVYLDGQLAFSTRDGTYLRGFASCVTKGSMQSKGHIQITEFSTLSLDTLAKGEAKLAQEKPQTVRAPTEVEMWLAQVDAQMQQSYRKEALAPYETSLGVLKKGYLTALEQQIAAASGGGQLEAAVAWRAERQSYLERGQELQADDSDLATNAVAKTLTPLRSQYRGQLAKLEAERLTHAKPIFAQYEAALETNITQLTKRQRLDDALLLKAKLEAVREDWLGATGIEISTPGSLPTERSSMLARAWNAARLTVKSYPKGDDRKAAEWVLRVGGNVTVEERGKSIVVKRLEDLNMPSFHLTEVRLDFYYNPPKEPVDDLEALAGLEQLASIRTEGLPLRDEDLAPLTSLPQLKSLTMHVAALTDNAVDYLTMMPALVHFEAEFCRAFTGRRLGEFAGRKLQKLSLYGCPVSPESFAAIARNQQLTSLDLAGTPTTDGDLNPLAKLSNLQTLILTRTRTTLPGISTLHTLTKLRALGWNFTPGKGPEELAELGRLFPKVTSYTLEAVGQKSYDEADFAALSAFRNLTQVTANGPSVGDEAMRGLLMLKSLRAFRTGHDSGITDAGLASLSKHQALQNIALETSQITDAGLLDLVALRQLNSLYYSNCQRLTEAGLAAFSKARPDVTLLEW